MADLLCVATGNFTASSTWQVADSTSTQKTNSTDLGTSTTTSYVESSAFTPGAITIDAIYVYLAARADSPSGTVSVRLAQGGATVTNTEVTINVSDMKDTVGETANIDYSDKTRWVCFDFGTSVTLAAATQYTVSIKSSVNAEANFGANSGDWMRLLRTTTTQAPAAGDDMVIAKAWTSAGTGTAYTVTMDNTATTDFGSADTSNYGHAMCVGDACTLTWGTTAATNYHLKLSGHLVICDGATVSVGTTGTPIPRDSSATLEFDSTGQTATNMWGIVTTDGSTLNMQGLSRTAAKNVVQTYLTADLAASGTSATVNDDTGWLSGDNIAIAGTTRTYTEAEQVALTANAGASSLTIGAVTNAHSGTAPAQGHIILLTRNVRVIGQSVAASTFLYCAPTATIDLDWVEFRYLSTASPTNREGVVLHTTTGGDFDMDFCSIWDCEDHGIRCSATPFQPHNIHVHDTVFYNLTVGSSAFISMSSANASSTNIDFNRITIIKTSLNDDGFALYTPLSATGCTFDNLICANAGGAGINYFTESNSSGGTPTGWEAYGCDEQGISWGNTSYVMSDVTATNFKVWRNNGIGLSIQAAGQVDNVFNNFVAFGNNPHNIECWYLLHNLVFEGGALDSDTTYSTTDNFSLNNGQTYGNYHNAEVTFHGTEFSNAGAPRAAATNEIDNDRTVSKVCILCDNCTTGSTNDISTGTWNDTNHRDSFIAFHRQGQVDDTHKTYKPHATIEYDASVFNSAAPSCKVTPNSTTYKAKSPSAFASVDDGATVTASVYVRKDAAYTGAQPRLIARQNRACGITSDTVLDTMSVGVSTWEQLSGTTATSLDDGVIEFYVDCDGTAGYINIDDWAMS